MRALILGTFGFAAIVVAACGGGSTTTGSGGDTSSSSTGTGASGGSMSSSSSSSSSTGGPATIETFTQDVAGSICNALFRCCDAQSTTDYFAAWAGNTLLESFADKIPPKKAFADEAECAATVKQMIEIIPFGDWVAQVKDGKITFDPAAFSACKATLDGAACGKDVALALYDSTCFGFGPPLGGQFQRKSFQRTAKAGDACTPIRDGVGTGFFGTCDPTGFFCCYEDPAAPNTCAFPFKGGDTPRSGVCKAASQEGQACSFFGSLQICVTGLSCDTGTDKCVADGQDPLMVGEPCIDSNFNQLGICQNSWCDSLGSGNCEAFKADGEACLGSEECVSQACVMGKCGAPTFCLGK